ncbi:MAG TPA: hypothetical protein PKX17_05505, partial [Candidatus Methanomethylicus sp.]|nr:hypothetical protein [Candidatus Methanomethylicus sp.]
MTSKNFILVLVVGVECFFGSERGARLGETDVETGPCFASLASHAKDAPPFHILGQFFPRR